MSVTCLPPHAEQKKSFSKGCNSSKLILTVPVRPLSKKPSAALSSSCDNTAGSLGGSRQHRPIAFSPSPMLVSLTICKSSKRTLILDHILHVCLCTKKMSLIAPNSRNATLTLICRLTKANLQKHQYCITNKHLVGISRWHHLLEPI